MNYLTQKQKIELDFINKIRAGHEFEVPKIVTQVILFDPFYYYSDSRVVYNNGEKREKELTELINKVEDEELKSALRLGMGAIKNRLDEIYDLYPHLKYICFKNQNPSDEVSLALAKFTDEQVSLFKFYLNELSLSLNQTEGIVKGGLVHTCSIPHPKYRTGEISVNPKLQKALHDFEKNLIKTMIVTLPPIFKTKLDSGWVVSLQSNYSTEKLYGFHFVKDDNIQYFNCYL